LLWITSFVQLIAFLVARHRVFLYYVICVKKLSF